MSYDDDYPPTDHLLSDIVLESASLAFWEHHDGAVSLHVCEADAPFATVYFLDRLQLIDLARGCLAAIAALEER